jgi:hypothetical protein
MNGHRGGNAEQNPAYRPTGISPYGSNDEISIEYPVPSPKIVKISISANHTLDNR